MWSYCQKEKNDSCQKDLKKDREKIWNGIVTDEMKKKLKINSAFLSCKNIYKNNTFLRLGKF